MVPQVVRQEVHDDDGRDEGDQVRGLDPAGGGRAAFAQGVEGGAGARTA